MTYGMAADTAAEYPGTLQGLRTEFPFVLPRGYLDAAGVLHREGVLRLATALDAVAPQADPRVRANPAYLAVLLLARTVTRLGRLEAVGTDAIEGLFAADFGFLQDLYRRVNAAGHTEADVRCPVCAHEFTVDLAGEEPG